MESEVDTSEGEGSEYDKDDFESELKNKKRQRKENKKSSNKKKKNELSAIVLPLPGDKTVAAEAFEKLTGPQKKWSLIASIRQQRRCRVFHALHLSLLTLISVSFSLL
jgi:hypothetical protein